MDQFFKIIYLDLNESFYHGINFILSDTEGGFRRTTKRFATLFVVVSIRF
jgi:hypothetical protein